MPVVTAPPPAARRLRRGAVVLALGAALALLPAPVAAAPEPPPIVLVLYGAFTGFSPHDRFHDRLVETLDGSSQRRVDVRAEFFDASGARDEAYDALVIDYLRRKYSPDRIAAVVGIGARPIELAIKVRATLFPSAALVYGLADEKRMAGYDYGPNATGVTGTTDITGTVALALQLVPRATRVALVVGGTEIERAWYSRIVEDARAASANAELVTLFGLSEKELLGRLATLPEGTVVVWVSFFRGPQDDLSVPADVLGEALDASNAPIFGLFDGEFGRGIVGGRIVDIGRHGEETGGLIARVLNGEPAGSIPPIYVANNPAAIDWRALERWGIDPQRLPDDAVVSYRAPTLWDDYGQYIVGVGAVLLIQTLLIVGLMAQRSRRLRTQRSLAERLRFERLYAYLSTRFVDLPDDGIDAALAGGLEEVRIMYDADRVSLVEFGSDPARSSLVYVATSKGVEPLSEDLDTADLRELIEHVRAGGSLLFSRLDEIPPALSAVREATIRRGLHAGIVVPLHATGSNFGCLVVAARDEPQTWPEDAASRLRTLADIFANAIVRKRAAAQLHRSEEMSAAVLKSIAAQVCVLDREGRIVTMNDAWSLDAGETNGHRSCRLVGDRCPMEPGARVRCAAVESGPLQDRIRASLDGAQQSFTAEYHSATPNTDAWYLLTVEQFRTLEGGVVMSHQSITARKRAELDAEQRRQELAHVSRVSTMGELAASIAHELNQPLTGVLTNAQAALRFLDVDRPDLAEVREILSDIVEDDRRAGEVIRRLRAMLRKSGIEPADVDLNEVVADVLKLLATDATLRNVTIETSLSEGLPPIRADHIQLEQVILNLVVNAMEAMKETPASERRVMVRTVAFDTSTVLVSVSDRGPGIDQDKLGRVFQPFFTTKAEGMGMGLSIARTIVEAHGGVLWAVNNPDRGASFHVRLPASSAGV